MKFLRSKRGAITAVVVVVALLFLVRPGANRLRTRIVNSISTALGHPVDVAYVRVHLLPRPGFDLKQFVVHEDPAFGNEPLLRADEVTASLRLSSLLRGRIEIARLSLAEPSLNLVRNSQGHWNLESLLERTAHLQVAPTSKSRGEGRPAFPYVEASQGRINVKVGVEKKAYALTDADFALWQDSENAWGFRLRATPFGTDFHLSDTGTIQAVGSWQRAATLKETPLQFSFLWERAQLGQVSKLAYGNDKGWRGTAALSATMTGTPANLKIESDVSVRDFRRYDVSGGGELRLTLHCGAYYGSIENRFSDIACQAPVGNGFVRAEGELSSPFASPAYQFSLIARGAPIQSLVALARHARPGIPDDLAATGQLDANMSVARAPNGPMATWSGSGETSAFHLTSGNADLALNSVPLTVSSTLPSKTQRQQKWPGGNPGSPATAPYFVIGASHVDLGKSAMQWEGLISRSGYDFQISGESQLQKLLHAAHMVGLPAVQSAAEGTAGVDLKLAGGWFDSTPARAVGTVQLHSIRAAVRGARTPLEIASAELKFDSDVVKVQGLTASWAGTAWRGSLTFDRPCAMQGTCPIRLDLHADEISTDRLNDLFNPNARQQPWYRFFSSSSSGPSFLLTLNAAGKLAADRLLIHKLTASRLTGQVEIANGKFRFSDLRADVLGGKNVGDWTADFSTKPPVYTGNGSLLRASFEQLAHMMNDGWITGVGTANYKVRATGLSPQDLLASATGTLRIDASDCEMPHITLAPASPLQTRRFTASLLLQDGTFRIESGKIETSDGDYAVAGTASLNRTLNVKLTREGTPGFAITGTLAAPKVSRVVSPETRAELKP